MTIHTTYTALRRSLASFLDSVTDGNEVVIVKRQRAPRHRSHPC